jgi:uncharacterized membrane protein
VPATVPPAARLRSIDALRGLAVVLMVLDHARVYAGIPAGGDTPGVFFTRWITHYCAPAFVFLAGTSAYLYGRTHRDLPRFLVTRGVLLVVLELTVVRLAWTFNLDFAGYELAGVLWVLGWCMVLLAALSKLPAWAVAAIGLVIVVGHNAFDARLAAVDGPVAWGWKLLYVAFYAGPIEAGPDGPRLVVLYTLIPWIGVMAAGYGFGALVTHPRRDRWCAAIGLGAIAAFVVLRAVDGYGDPRPWAESSKPAWLAFLDTAKYPASLAFVLMTLGPMIAALPLAERARGPIARALASVGSVPLFFYLVHLPLVHALAIAVSALRTGGVDRWLYANHPMAAPPPPADHVWSLPLLYLVWAIATVLLALACRWYAAVKRRHPGGWLRYL